MPITAPLPIPEGDVFKFGGNFTKHTERKENYSQIFATPKYGITGTHQASTFRFGDDFVETRAYYMDMYKHQKVGAILYGLKSEQLASNSNAMANGQPVRTLGGLLDYALFPISYIKKPLAKIGIYDSNIEPVTTMSNWMSEVANTLLAFRTNGSKNLTLFCSQAFIDKLDVYTRLTIANNNYMAGQVQRVAPSQLTFGLEIFTFKTTKGVQINFIHEPALDMMAGFPVAYHRFGVSYVDPKDILLSVDMNNIKQVVCRPDQIHGGIQEIGQDAFLEGMRGESSFKLRFPKNHAIIYAPTS